MLYSITFIVVVFFPFLCVVFNQACCDIFQVDVSLLLFYTPGVIKHKGVFT